MIKINLLGGAHPTAVRAPSEAPTGLGLGIAFGVSLLVTGGIALSLYLLWSIDLKTQEDAKKVELKRQAELAEVKRDVLRFTQYRDQLLQRINTIQKLQASRSGPVPLMAALNNTVNRTNDIYLMTVSPEGARIAIRGMADSVDGLATFIAALNRTPVFSDVQLRQYFEDDRDDRLSFKFSLDLVYKPPAPTPPASPPATQPGAPQRRVGM